MWSLMTDSRVLHMILVSDIGLKLVNGRSGIPSGRNAEVLNKTVMMHISLNNVHIIQLDFVNSENKLFSP